MPIFPAPLPEGADTSPQPLGRSLPLDDPFSSLSFSPVVGKAQKVERLRFVQWLVIGTPTAGLSERYQPCLFRVQLQSILLEALEDDSVHSLGIRSMRKAYDQIVSESHRKYPPHHPFPHDFCKPLIEHLVQVDIGQQR